MRILSFLGRVVVVRVLLFWGVGEGVPRGKNNQVVDASTLLHFNIEDTFAQISD
jgi:hypothetical protein